LAGEVSPIGDGFGDFAAGVVERFPLVLEQVSIERRDSLPTRRLHLVDAEVVV
jgi:hypothetical protein